MRLPWIVMLNLAAPKESGIQYLCRTGAIVLFSMTVRRSCTRKSSPGGEDLGEGGIFNWLHPMICP